MKLYEMILLEAKDEYVVKAFGPKLVDQWYADSKKQKPPNMTPDQVSEIALSFVRDTLVPLDPTPNQKFLVWVAKLYADGNLKQEDFYKVSEELQLFQKFQQKLEKKDIMQYKSLPDLVDAIESVKNVGEPISNKAKAKAERAQQLEGAELVYDKPSLKIYSPKTQAAACELGRGTRWCTAATSANNMFDSYNSTGPLYIFFINPSPEYGPYQMHVEGKIDSTFGQGRLPDWEDQDIRIYIADSRDRTVKTETFLKLLNDADREFVVTDLMAPSEDGPPASVKGLLEKYPAVKDIKSLPLEYRGPYAMTTLLRIHSKYFRRSKSDVTEARLILKRLGGEAMAKAFLKTAIGQAYLPNIIHQGTSYSTPPGALDGKLDEFIRSAVGKNEYTQAYMKSRSASTIIGERDPFKGLPPKVQERLNIAPRDYLLWILNGATEDDEYEWSYRIRTSGKLNLLENLMNAAKKPGTTPTTKKIHTLLNQDPEVRKLVIKIFSKKTALSALLMLRRQKKNVVEQFSDYATDEEKSVLIKSIKDLYARRKAGDNSSLSLTDLRDIYKIFSSEKGTLDHAVLSASTPEDIAKNIVNIHGKDLNNGWYIIDINPSIETKVFGTNIPANKNATSIGNTTHYVTVANSRFILYTVSQSTGQEWLTVLPFDPSNQTKTKVTINPSQVKLYDLDRLTINNEGLAQSIAAIRKIGRQRLKPLKLDKDSTLEAKQWTKSKKN
jgi:hypothetical protein